MTTIYDNRVKPNIFKDVDLVLRKFLPLLGEYQIKWAPNYEGPYVVRRMDGDDLPRHVNSDSIKKYYV